MFYEYKVIAPPRRAMRFKDLAKGEDAFQRTVSEMLTALGLEGWTFVGVERLPQTRRRFLFWSHDDVADLMVFRREIRPILPDVQPKKVEQDVLPVAARRVARPETLARLERGERRLRLAERPHVAAE